MAVNQVWASVVVRRPINEVWDVIADADQFQNWCKMVWFGGGPFEQDKAMTLVLPLRLFRVRVTVTITRCEDQDEIRWDAKFGCFRGRPWLRLRALNDEQTQIAHVEDYEGLCWIWPRIRHDVHAEYQKAVEKLAAYLEK